MNNTYTVGQALREARYNLQVSQKSLGELIGNSVAPGTISNLERDSAPGALYDHLWEIRDIIGCSTIFLLNLVQNTPKIMSSIYKDDIMEKIEKDLNTNVVVEEAPPAVEDPVVLEEPIEEVSVISTGEKLLRLLEITDKLKATGMNISVAIPA